METNGNTQPKHYGLFSAIAEMPDGADFLLAAHGGMLAAMNARLIILDLLEIIDELQNTANYTPIGKITQQEIDKVIACARQYTTEIPEVKK